MEVGPSGCQGAVSVAAAWGRGDCADRLAQANASVRARRRAPRAAVEEDTAVRAKLVLAKCLVGKRMVVSRQPGLCESGIKEIPIPSCSAVRRGS